MNHFGEIESSARLPCAILRKSDQSSARSKESDFSKQPAQLIPSFHQAGLHALIHSEQSESLGGLSGERPVKTDPQGFRRSVVAILRRFSFLRPKTSKMWNTGKSHASPDRVATTGPSLSRQGHPTVAHRFSGGTSDSLAANSPDRGDRNSYGDFCGFETTAARSRHSWESAVPDGT